MKNTFFLISCLTFILFGSACKKLKTPDSVLERDAMFESFNDSIALYQNKTEEASLQMNGVNETINQLLEDFTYVSNPREVNGYYILKGWEKQIPLKTTGIYARINEDEKLEIIATLAGGTFNQISVSDGSQTAYSGVVAHDQALNYRYGNLNRVCFSGVQADSMARFIAINQTANIKLNFIEGGKDKSVNIPDNQKTMIAKTWNLYEHKSEALNLEKQIWFYSEKIKRLHQMIENKEKPMTQNSQQ